MHTQAFNRLKSKISNDCLIHFYDAKKLVFIECDSSGVGIGAVLLQPAPIVLNLTKVVFHVI